MIVEYRGVMEPREHGISLSFMDQIDDADGNAARHVMFQIGCGLSTVVTRLTTGSIYV